MGGERMMIYIAHSKKDYGSDYISDIKERIVMIYGEDTEIVDPSKYVDQCVSEKERGGFLKNMLDVFYPLISKCDVLVAVPDSESKRYTLGVMNEVRFAKGVGTDVWEM